MAVISDKKIGFSFNGRTLDYYKPDLVSATDYYPFGMVSRSGYFGNLSLGYPFGFGGQMKSDEIKGEGNSYTAEFWEYDPRIGRRWNLDLRPITGQSPYAAFNNNPIWFTDPLGDTSVRGAGGMHTVDIDERRGSLQFYNALEYRIKGTSTVVPVKNGQLRSFTNVVGTFNATWSTDANGNAVFVGYKNDKGQTFEAAAKQMQDNLSGWKGMIYRFGAAMKQDHDADPTAHTLKISFALITTSLSAAAEPGLYGPVRNPSTTTLDDMAGMWLTNSVSRSQTLALVTKYPGSPGIAGTTENTFLMPGQIIDRYGSTGGQWFSTPGTSYGARSIPSGLSPYTKFRVLKPFEVQKSLASPGMFSGQYGFGNQFRSPVSVNVLLRRGIITPIF